MAAEITMTCGEPLDAALCAKRFLADLDRTRGEFASMFWEGRRGDDPCAPRSAAHPVGCLEDRDTVLRVATMQAADALTYLPLGAR